ncbi:coiled-coil domain-containing protein 42 [Melanerpes formicivorus]|uniref:coiled-coil domain-containing protein 42 n=1 Tax=Melanerpes formicivorus TaxID=211600 RepID=UPI00358E4DE5
MATTEEEDLLAYFLMQYRQNLLTLIRKLKLTEEEPLSSFIHLQDKKKEAKEMQKLVEVKEEAFRERMELILRWWKALCVEEEQMKPYVEKGERILQDEEVPIRALQDATRERERTVQMESELLRAKRELEALRRQYLKHCHTARKYSIFHRSLEDVVKISQFEERQEIIWRYKTLLRMSKDLLQSRQEDKELAAQADMLLKQHREQIEAGILQYQNEMEQLPECFDQAQKEVFLWETCWGSFQDLTAEKTQRLGCSKMAILNLFQITRLWMEVNLNVPADDSCAQMSMTQHLTEDIKDLCMKVKLRKRRRRRRAAAPPEL